MPYTTSPNPDYKGAALQLLKILQDIAPNGAAQELVSTKYKECQTLAGSDKEFLLYMSNMLYDGLHYNNWPWNRF